MINFTKFAISARQIFLATRFARDVILLSRSGFASSSGFTH